MKQTQKYLRKVAAAAAEAYTPKHINTHTHKSLKRLNCTVKKMYFFKWNNQNQQTLMSTSNQVEIKDTHKSKEEKENQRNNSQMFSILTIPTRICFSRTTKLPATSKEYILEFADWYFHVLWCF